MVKDRIVEALSKNAPVTKRAPPVYLLATIEGYVMDESELAVWRVVARSKLVEVWACLRWDDLQSTKPAELTFADGRLTTILRKTKTSGPNRSVKELPVCVSARALFLDSRWLGWGFQGLCQLAAFDRDYILSPSWTRQAIAASGRWRSTVTRLATRLGPLSPLESIGCDSGFKHSERSVFPTGLAMLDNDKAETHLLGRWKPEWSDIYARTFNRREAKLQRQFGEANVDYMVG